MYNQLPSSSYQDPRGPPPYLPSSDQLWAVASYPPPEFEHALAAQFRAAEGLGIEDSTRKVKQFFSQFLSFYDLVSRQGTLPLSSPQTAVHQSVPANPRKPPDPVVRDCINVSPPIMSRGLVTPSSSGGSVPEVMDRGDGPEQHQDWMADRDVNWNKYIYFPDD
ncbi:hypothetical protein ACJ41O_014538 [Fusarium nematophilum]